MEWTRTTIGEGGRIVVPAEFRKALGLKAGDVIMIGREDGQIRIMTVREAIRRDQEWVRSFVPPGRSLVDELIAERREEAERE